MDTNKSGKPSNNNPYGFTEPTGPASQAIVNWKNSKTGETWMAGSGGWTPPSSDWQVDSGSTYSADGSLVVGDEDFVRSGPPYNGR